MPSGSGSGDDARVEVSLRPSAIGRPAASRSFRRDGQGCHRPWWSQGDVEALGRGEGSNAAAVDAHARVGSADEVEEGGS